MLLKQQAGMEFWLLKARSEIAFTKECFKVYDGATVDMTCSAVGKMG